MRRQYAGFFAPYDHVYDPLLDDFEPGMRPPRCGPSSTPCARSRSRWSARSPSADRQVDDAVLHLPYDHSKQWAFGVEVVRAFGYDFNARPPGQVGPPFTTSFGVRRRAHHHPRRSPTS